MTANPGGIAEFFPLFGGKTWEMTGTQKLRQTLDGDGIVAQTESVLPGISLDVIPASMDTEGNLPPANQYCHINMTKNPRVNDRVMYYLASPGT